MFSVKKMTLKEAHVLTLRVLKQVMEEKLDQHNVQIAQVSVDVFLRLVNADCSMSIGYSSRRV